jgi:hypothetical protein
MARDNRGWRDIPGWPYKRAIRAGQDERLNRLVLQTFKREPRDHEEARHLDSDRWNDAASNPAWVSHRENMQARGCGWRHTWTDEETVLEVRCRRAQGASLTEPAR